MCSWSKILRLRNRNAALDTCKVFKAKVEKQSDKQIKIVRTDGDEKYYERYTKNGEALGPFAKFNSSRE